MLLEYGYTAALGKAVAQVVDGILCSLHGKNQERASDAGSTYIEYDSTSNRHIRTQHLLDDAILMYQRLSSTFYPEMLDP